MEAKEVSVWVSDDKFSKEEAFVAPNIFGDEIVPDDALMEIVLLKDSNPQQSRRRSGSSADEAGVGGGERSAKSSNGTLQGQNTSQSQSQGLSAGQDRVTAIDPSTRYCFIAKPLATEIQSSHPSLQVLISENVSATLGYPKRAQALVSLVSRQDRSASHVELVFRDMYISRSDMWRLARAELVGKTIYAGQKVGFLGSSIKAVAKTVVLGGVPVSSAYFSEDTIPIFRSESARFILFIQMSREMWEFDAEGTGEILSSRVINGFLPELFKKWLDLDARHLVTIVLFSRVEYDQYGLSIESKSNTTMDIPDAPYQDFYRVVVTDMSSGQWTVILDELKKDFRIFLRDITLYKPNEQSFVEGYLGDTTADPQTWIRGAPTSAIRGNILEAINIASSQFSNDHLDRDLVRTGISVIVITPGTGVFEVDRHLLELTSENLTNNGIGIDLVCMSKVPLHIVPLFKWQKQSAAERGLSFDKVDTTSDSGSIKSSSLRTLPRPISPKDRPAEWSFGIPQWVDVSYWAPKKAQREILHDHGLTQHLDMKDGQFVPQVRMYELQMMGVMELGLSSISIPYLKESLPGRDKTLSPRRSNQDRYGFSPLSPRSVALSPMPKQRGLLSANALLQGDMYERMDDYDANLFTLSKNKTKSGQPAGAFEKRKLAELEPIPSPEIDTTSLQSGSTKVNPPRPGLLSQSIRAKRSDARISRHINFALRGLGPSPRAIASTEVNIENIEANASLRVKMAGTDTLRNTRSERGTVLDEPTTTPDMVQTPSRPIAINSASKDDNSLRALKVDKTSSRLSLADTEKTTPKEIPEIVSSSPSWINNIDSCNPSRNVVQASRWVGRWQHLFPYVATRSSVRWKSLCIPAGVPLTTEQFPTKAEWVSNYVKTSYIVSLGNSELEEVPKTRAELLQEMICLRLSHGYQVVVGRQIAETIGKDVMINSNHFSFGEGNLMIYLLMGSTIQRLVGMNDSSIQVTRFVKKSPVGLDDGKGEVVYRPIIRTVLSKFYIPRSMILTGSTPSYAWNVADPHIAGRTEELVDIYDPLRFWRARFVVIPVTAPADRRPAYSTSDDNEEEVHLLGIRELTKMWQKARYVTPEEGRFKRLGQRKDPNPLNVLVQTLNASEVVATEIEKLLANEGDDGRSVQLLPESELLERSSTSLVKIGQMLQSEKGVEIANRRWHGFLHDPCFKGDDLTNWLIASFKDIDGREDAVDFGNELMQLGLFTHVSKRHAFKDGNYFYKVTEKHRTDRPDSRSSWFRRDRNVPSTPASAEFPDTRLTESRSSDKTIHEKRQLSVSLTKMMRIDVDHRTPKRSDRPEVVNLHYDRLHNPESCYHFELCWFNVTAKLVDDAVANWTTQVEKYGLRIMQVPIAEVGNVSANEREPFRAPYRVVLKVPPPETPIGKGHFTSTSFTAQTAPSTHKLAYHKALLRKLNFVLDFEAASDFPPDVQVTHTWGKLEYQSVQFIHRSGLLIAQITDDGEFLLLGNRLYDRRSAVHKDSSSKFDSKTPTSAHHHRPFAASGIVGLNVQNPSPYPSPSFPSARTTSSQSGSKPGLGPTYITPELIKDQLESFCADPVKLRAFYQEFNDRGPSPASAVLGGGLGRKPASGSSSVLRPVPENGLEGSIPDLRLPASVTGMGMALGSGGLKSAFGSGKGRGRRVSPKLDAGGDGAGAGAGEGVGLGERGEYAMGRRASLEPPL